MVPAAMDTPPHGAPCRHGDVPGGRRSCGLLQDGPRRPGLCLPGGGGPAPKPEIRSPCGGWGVGSLDKPQPGPFFLIEGYIGHSTISYILITFLIQTSGPAPHRSRGSGSLRRRWPSACASRATTPPSSSVSGAPRPTPSISFANATGLS